MKLAKIAGVLAASLAMFAAPLVSAHATELPGGTDSADTEHIPGAPGAGDMVPADTMVPADSPAADPAAKPNAQGLVPHICAGKKLLHHSHVDAAYVTRVNGEFTVTVVDGQHVVQDPSKVCVRLAPDSRSEDGLEVSRMVVPVDWKYSFLGKPGDIVWRAPQEQIDNWRPVWAGIGAFDAAHEVKQPEGMLLDEVKLNLVDKKGPGNVDIWRTVGETGLNRGLSSSDDLGPLLLHSGFHGHWNWTFSKAGVYQLGLQASYVDMASNKTVKSKLNHITWLVGSDKEVGLPEGTTTGLHEIKISTEDVKAQMTKAGEFKKVAKDPTVAHDLTPEEAEAQIRSVARRPPKAPTKAQHYIYKGSFADEEIDGKMQKMVHLDVVNAKGEAMGTPIIEVPDSLRQNTSAGPRWVLPPDSRYGSLTFDFSGLPKEMRSQPVTYSMDMFFGPDGGRHIAGIVKDGELDVTLDSWKPKAKNRAIVTDGDTTAPLTHIFTKPGLHWLSFTVSTTNADGRYSYGSRNAYFVVGDSSIKALHKMTGVDEPMALADPLPGQGDQTPAEPSPSASATPEPTATPTAEPTSEPSPSAEPTSEPTAPPTAEPTVTPSAEPTTPAPAPSSSAPAEPTEPQPGSLHIITEGHVDQALAYDGKTARVFADDTADPRKPVLRESGTFAYAVPDVTHTFVPADAHGYDELRKAAPNGVWVLPETQLDGIPWVGFSTLRVNYDLLSDKGVTIELRNFSGPGRMITGQSSLFDGFVKRLDSAEPKRLLTYLFGTHDHQAMYFTAPGVYTTDFVYVLHLKNGTTIEKPLRVTFLVGDRAVEAARAPKPEPSATAEPTGEPSAEPSATAEPTSEPSSEPTSEPTPAPTASAQPTPAPTTEPSKPGEPGQKLSIDDLVAKLNAEERGKKWEGPSSSSHPAGGSQTAPAKARPMANGPRVQKPVPAKSAAGKPAPAKSRTTGAVPVHAPNVAASRAALLGTTITGASASGTSGAASGPLASGIASAGSSAGLLPAVGAVGSSSDPGLGELKLGGGASTGDEAAAGKTLGSKPGTQSARDILGGANAKPTDGADLHAPGNPSEKPGSVTALKKPDKPVSALLNPKHGAEGAELSGESRGGTPAWQWALVALGAAGVLGAGGWAVAHRRRD